MKSQETKQQLVKVKAENNLSAITLHPNLGLTREQFIELKYGSGITEVEKEKVVPWLFEKNHIKIMEE